MKYHTRNPVAQCRAHSASAASRYQLEAVLCGKAVLLAGTLLSTWAGTASVAHAQDTENNVAQWHLIADEANSESRNYAPKPPSPPPQRSDAYTIDDNRQRSQERQLRLETQMRQAMSNMGCTDIAVQDAIISYIGADLRARRPLLAQSRRLFAALRATDSSDEKLGEMVGQFRTAVEADRQRRAQGEAALDARIKYSQNPRLEGMLILFGVIGDSPFLSVLRDGTPDASPPTPPAAMQNAAPRNTPQLENTPVEANPKRNPYPVESENGKNGGDKGKEKTKATEVPTPEAAAPEATSKDDSQDTPKKKRGKENRDQ